MVGAFDMNPKVGALNPKPLGMRYFWSHNIRLSRILLLCQYTSHALDDYFKVTKVFAADNNSTGQYPEWCWDNGHSIVSTVTITLFWHIWSNITTSGIRFNALYTVISYRKSFRPLPKVWQMYCITAINGIRQQPPLPPTYVFFSWSTVYYTTRFNEVERGGILVSPCPSLRLWTESSPLFILNNTRRIHSIFTHLIKQHQKVCRV